VAFELYPESASGILELDELQRAVGEGTQTGGGLDLLGAWMQPVTEPELWEERQHLYRECLGGMKSGAVWPALRWELSQPLLALLGTEGYVLTEEEVAALWMAVHTCMEVEQILFKHRESMPRLASRMSGLASLKPAWHLMTGMVDRQGHLLPQASPLLARLSVQLQRKQQEVRDWMEQFWRKAREAGWATDLGVTLREDRFVVVLNAEGRKQVSGMVHDVSASGQHFYLEPVQAQPLNNALREAEWAIRQEKYRLLALLSKELRPYAGVLKAWSVHLFELDVLRAVCGWASQFAELHFPERIPQGHTWERAVHPWLELECRTRGGHAVPYSWSLDSGHRMLVVSGPNAGGKSVFLKTAALFQVLFQCGWPLPCGAQSKASLLQRVVLAMGDRQNLHQDLSTYAAHLQLMAYALQKADSQTLVVLDEYGAGTDPALGGALAEAMLEPWLREGPLVLMNTHYGNLKRLSAKWPTVQNARMGFDTQTLQPNYRILLGAPGSSYALELAQRAGLGQEIMDRARELSNQAELQTETLLVEWMEQKQKAEEMLQVCAVKDELLDRLIRKQEAAALEDRDRQEAHWENLRRKARKMLEEKRGEAGRLLQDFKSALDELKVVLREKSRTALPVQGQGTGGTNGGSVPEPPHHAGPNALWNKALDLLGSTLEGLSDLQQDLPGAQEGGSPAQERPSPFREGQTVRLSDGTLRGHVLKSDPRSTEWMVDSVRMRIDTHRLVAVPDSGRGRSVAAPASVSRPALPSSGQGGKAFLQDMPLPDQVLDLRGLRMHEWEGPLQKRLDRAVVAGEDRLYILHGKGSGALRQAVREFLRRQKEVLSMQDAPEESGGAGWTWIQLVP